MLISVVRFWLFILLCFISESLSLSTINGSNEIDEDVIQTRPTRDANCNPPCAEADTVIGRNRYKNLCVLGNCVRCVKYQQSCSRSEAELHKSFCCPTPGKGEVACRAMYLQPIGDYDSGICSQDRCASGNRHDLVSVRFPGYYPAAQRCDTATSEVESQKYDYECRQKTCKKCKMAGERCRTQEDCCKYAACEGNRVKFCIRKYGDIGFIVTDYPDLPCEKGLIRHENKADQHTYAKKVRCLTTNGQFHY